jgi:Flp pilus assembly protein TadG
MKTSQAPAALARPLRRRGASAVELAIILPVLVLIFGACIDLARFAYTDIALTNAVRAGGAWTMLNPPSSMASPPTAWQTSIQTAVSNEMSLQTGYDSSSLTVSTVSPVSEAGGTWRFTITATYPFNTIISWSGLGIPSSITMSQSITMRGIR